MADDRYWVGGTDGDFDVNANWKQSDLTSASATPVDGDSVYFTTGSVDVDENLAVDDIALVNFVVTDGYSGQLGLVGTHLDVDVTNFTYDGRGAANYIDFKSDTDATATIVVVLGTGSGMLNLGTDTNGTISSGTYLGGTVAIADSTAHTASTNLLIASGPANISETSVTIGASVTNLTTITHLAGALTIGSAYTTLVQVGGTVTHTAGALTAANVYGGTFNAESAGTVGSIKVYDGGYVNGSGSEIARTWTNVEQFGSGAINIANGRGNITLTNDIITHTSGQLPITVDQGSTVAVS